MGYIWGIYGGILGVYMVYILGYIWDIYGGIYRVEIGMGLYIGLVRTISVHRI